MRVWGATPAAAPSRLLRELDELARLDGPRGFQRRDRREGPAAAALLLILNGVDLALGSPVPSRRRRGRAEGARVRLKAIRKAVHCGIRRRHLGAETSGVGWGSIVHNCALQEPSTHSRRSAANSSFVIAENSLRPIHDAAPAVRGPQWVLTASKGPPKVQGTCQAWPCGRRSVQRWPQKWRGGECIRRQCSSCRTGSSTCDKQSSGVARDLVRARLVLSPHMANSGDAAAVTAAAQIESARIILWWKGADKPQGTLCMFQSDVKMQNGERLPVTAQG